MNYRHQHRPSLTLFRAIALFVFLLASTASLVQAAPPEIGGSNQEAINDTETVKPFSNITIAEPG